MSGPEREHAEWHAEQARALGAGLQALIAGHANLRAIALIVRLNCGFKISINLGRDDDSLASIPALLRAAADEMEKSEPFDETIVAVPPTEAMQ